MAVHLVIVLFPGVLFRLPMQWIARQKICIAPTKQRGDGSLFLIQWGGKFKMHVCLPMLELSG
jgi:hypothetical protein